MNTIYGKGTPEAPYTPIATLNGGGGGGTPYELPQAGTNILGGVKANTVQQNGAATIDVLQNNGLLTLKAAGAGAAGGGSATNFGAVKGAALESGQTYVNAAVINGEVKTYTPIATQNTLGGVKASPKSSDMTQAVGIDSVGKLWVKGGGGDGKGIAILSDIRNEIFVIITNAYIFTDFGGSSFNLQPNEEREITAFVDGTLAYLNYCLPADYINYTYNYSSPQGTAIIRFEKTSVKFSIYFKNTTNSIISVNHPAFSLIR